jgi:predicted acetyltransferase
VSLEVRPLTADLVPAYLNFVHRTFWGSSFSGEELDRMVPSVELDRSLVVLDSGQVVGTAGAHRVALTIPGGIVTGAAGVSRVAVRPTHRRRGLLTRMMRRQLGDLCEQGEAVAILWASEGPIYGRFGYGLGTYSAQVQVEHARSGFASPVAGGRVREIDTGAAAGVLPDLTRRAAPRHPGFVQRDQGWWEYVLSDRVEDRDGLGELVAVVHEADGGPDGFALYRPEMARATSTLHLRSLVAVTDGAYGALWRHCLDVDLMSRLVAEGRSVEEPVRHLLADPRAAETRIEDGLWVRLIDVAAALAARRYQCEGRLRLRVEDPFCEWNAGTYELEGGPDGATCGRSGAKPDLVLPAAALGACHLGGNRFTTLARAGLVEASTAGALARADAMFAAPVAPWNPVRF